jgi:tetratricopeptide (TPR) repeat protein
LAESYLKKAISLNSKDPRYYIQLGILLYQNKKPEAGAVLDTAMKLDPNNVAAQFYAGKVLKDTKEFTASLPYFEKASRDQEYKTRAMVESGTCYMSLKMIDKAILELERAVKTTGKEDEADSM